MSSRRLVDPELAAVLDLTAVIDLSTTPLAQVRTQIVQLADAMRPAEPPPVKAVERMIPGPPEAPALRVLVYTPPGVSKPAPAVLQIHGGGYVFGTADMNDYANSLLSAGLGAIVVAVDYRLAPESPHPSPVEDCYAALRWLHGNSEALGVDPARIAISGDSAGGGAAAGLALLARDRGGPPIAFQHLIYPMLDDRTASAPPASPHVGEFVWTRANNMFAWRALLGAEPGSGDVSPYAAPARAKDLSGLPPTYIACGALDLFLEEDLEYARQLMTAGVPTEMHIYPGAPHAFMAAAEAYVSQVFARDSLAALKRALFPA
jgi:acetyl esterase/lipase